MNTVTRMYLVSEDQYKRNVLRPSITRRMLNKNLPTETKVKFINDMMARSGEKYDQPIYPQYEANSSQSEQYAPTSTQSRSDFIVSEEDSSPEPQFETGEDQSSSKPVYETMISDYPMTSTPAPSAKQYPITPYPKESPSESLSKETSATKARAKRELELAIRSIDGLVNENDEILDLYGNPIFHSKVDKIVDHFRVVVSNKRVPNGYLRVAHALMLHKPAIKKLIANKKVLSSWGMPTEWSQIVKS